DVIFSIFAYLGGFKKNWDSKAGTGESPEPNDIYNQAAEIFHLPTKRQFTKDLESLHDELQSQRRLNLQELYGQILKLLHVDDDEFHTEEHEIEMYNLGRLSQTISDYEGTRSYCTFKDIQRFCWFIRHYAEGAYDAGAGEDPTRVINAVQVMTLHGAKGLGFPVVFMPYCIERAHRSTPSGFLNPEAFNFSRYNGSVEDERRLFYVGLTRAKKYLFVTTSKQPVGKVRQKKPLQYFTELTDQACMTTPDADPTKRKRLPPQPSLEEYRFPTSYSELSDYIRCEYDYKMRYVYGFNPIIVQALGYGNQVHNLLNLLHKIAQQTGQVPLEEEAAKLLQEHFSLRYAASEQEETLKRSALRSILRYLNMWREDFSLSIKTERSFEMDLKNALLTGTIDLLKRENGDSNILEIIDFKTGNDRKDREALDLQVQLYTIAAREALDLNVQKAYVHFLDDQKQPRMEVLTTPKQLDMAMRTLSDAVQGITTRRFQRNPRSPKSCLTCDWEKICPQKKK
ncbi:MAG TPA: PD-(D/E)XK nuclease family protein, partial [Smithellaceae bacterium]|nr:PD-(D/E)XK nuclease family protein [Smithellaceae bacterium]